MILVFTVIFSLRADCVISPLLITDLSFRSALDRLGTFEDR